MHIMKCIEASWSKVHVAVKQCSIKRGTIEAHKHRRPRKRPNLHAYVQVIWRVNESALVVTHLNTTARAEYDAVGMSYVSAAPRCVHGDGREAKIMHRAQRANGVSTHGEHHHGHTAFGGDRSCTELVAAVR